MLRELNFKEIENKWQKEWLKNKIYKFNKKNATSKIFSIDTPPPYPTGEITPGNALNYIYCDIVARYKRMKGYNVNFPIGFDCHGLPTEVRVESILNKKKSEMKREEFYNACIKYTKIWIEAMKKDFIRLGISFDWDLEYLTMDPNYWKKTQLSFILMYKKGQIYREEHPIYWCTRCETAIAEAEIEYKKETRRLYYIKFKVNNEELTIATTRPELIPACVAIAVNPNDKRYKKILGKNAKVPLYDYEVPIISSKEVDPNFGSGAMMICTFGDKFDVRFQKKYKLPLKIIIDEKGRIKENIKYLEKLSILKAREKILEKLKEYNLLIKSEEILSEIGTCWRCHHNVEILIKKQWFIKSLELSNDILKLAKEIKWIPDFQRKRLENWINSLDWDWVISRQRIFATPIPVWYCKKCEEVIVAEENWLPVNPIREKPKINSCKCGSKEFKGETDVMDTWMDSSITCAVHAGWPDDFDKRLLPADLQPNGYDIIRSWDYYLLLRHYALFKKLAFKIALINGMVKGTDGRMMHKSYGNVIPLNELLDRYGTDAFRLWALGGVKTGFDIAVRFEDLDYNKRFLIKLWNASKYILTFTKEVKEKVKIKKLIDKWILNELQLLINTMNKFLNNYQFFEALLNYRTFVWNKLCDQYLEAVKYRTARNEKEAFYVLRNVLKKILLLLAPFAPYITEEIYQNLEKVKSIHLEKYPEEKEYSKEEIKEGEKLIKVIAELRRIKVKSGISLAKEIKKVIIYAGKYEKILRENKEDIQYTLRIKNLEILPKDKGKVSSEEVDGISYDIEF